MKLTLLLGALSASNIGIAFLFQWYVLVQLGPGMATDALFAGMTIPQLVLAVISGSLMHVLVPILTSESDDNRRHHDAWGLFILFGGLFSLIAITLFLTAPWWVALTVPGFSDSGKALTVELTRIQLISMVFSAVNGVQWAYYHAKQRFVWAEISPVLASTISFLLLMWALPRYGVIAAAWISALRMAIQTLLLLPGMGKPLWPNLRSSAISTAGHRIKPLILGTIYYNSESLVDRFLLSTANSGNLSLYYYAQQIYGAVSEIMSKAIGAPFLTKMSKLHNAGDQKGFKRAYTKKIWQVGAISLTGLIILSLYGEDLLLLLLRYGKLSQENVDLILLIMILMSGRFAIGNLGMVMTSMMYSIGDTNSPTKVSVVAYSLGVITKIILFYFAGTLGLALGVTIHYIIYLILMSKMIKIKMNIP